MVYFLRTSREHEDRRLEYVFVCFYRGRRVCSYPEECHQGCSFSGVLTDNIPDDSGQQVPYRDQEGDHWYRDAFED